MKLEAWSSKSKHRPEASWLVLELPAAATAWCLADHLPLKTMTGAGPPPSKAEAKELS